MKKIFTIIPLLFLSIALSAAPIGEKRAREIAISFFAEGATRTVTPVVELAWAGDDLTPTAGRFSTSTTNVNESLLYIYNRTDAKGHIVIAGDDVLRPIIAFSRDNTLDINNLPDGVRFMLKSWSKQIAAARAGKYTPTRVAGEGVGDVVLDYKTAEWNQGTPFNNFAPVYDGQNSVTGCVATALSIICHHNKWPDKGVGTTDAYSYEDDYGTERHISALQLGHTYDYANMRSDNYTNGYTSAEADAVATLMRDIGYGVQMMYHYVGSGAFDDSALVGMMKHFKYSKAAKMQYGVSFTDSEWVDKLINNIKNNGPTYLSGVDYGRNDVHVGHAFVLDGYTTGGYIHINYGWGGSGNAYYLIPSIDYMHNQTAFFDMVPDRDSTSQYSDNLTYVEISSNNKITYAGLTVASPIVVNTPCTIRVGAIYNGHIAQFDGYIRLVHCDKLGNVKSVLDAEQALKLDSGYYTYDEISVTPTQPFADGDKIVLQSRSANSQEWKNVLRQSENCSQSIILQASAEYIAEQLSAGVRYETNRANITIKNLLFLFPDKMECKSVTYTITNAAGTQVATGTLTTLADVEMRVPDVIAPGEYTVNLQLGGNSYSFELVL